MKTNKNVLAATIVSIMSLNAAAAADLALPSWKHLSSKNGDLPLPPGGSTQQTGAVVGDFDGDGVNDFMLSFRQKPPALVWYRRTAAGWDAYVVEKDYLTIEAGGAVHDIDGDGDLDLVFGGDWQSSDVWWWENPSPQFDKRVSWKRHVIKTGGKNQHHDQVFGDFLGTGKPQLVFWNQRAATLFLAEVPGNPRAAGVWPLVPVLTDAKPAGVPYIEGASAFDVDADGRLDILACDSWFKYTGDKRFKQIQFAVGGGLIFAGYFKSSKYPQIVISPGDAGGRVRLYECVGDPENAADWRAIELLDRDVVHGHSLQLGDVNGDGHLDIFVAEMAKWTGRSVEPDHPDATAWILYGDGQGNFTKTELVKGHGWHEARLSDLDGDGDLDLLNKPYTWETPRADVWLNELPQSAAKRVGADTSAPDADAASPDEPLRDVFSLDAAVAHLDNIAASWQRDRKCFACHSDYAFLETRPLVSGKTPLHDELRAKLEQLAAHPRNVNFRVTEGVMVACVLAQNDALTTGKLHPVTRQALDYMWTLQSEDGRFDWLKSDQPPSECDDHFGATMALIGVGVAPDGYAQTPAAQAGLNKIRQYLKNSPPVNLHQRSMLLLGSLRIDGIMTEADRKGVIDDLFAAQKPDGGWGIVSLGNWQRHDGKPDDTQTSDGYGTGFAIDVLRQAGVSADDRRIQAGIRWLKANQRVSGGWFTRSQWQDSRHYLSRHGTAYAIRALVACGVR